MDSAALARMRHPFFVSDLLSALLEDGRVVRYLGRGETPTATSLARTRGRVFSARIDAEGRGRLLGAAHSRCLLAGHEGERLRFAMADGLLAYLPDDPHCPGPLDLGPAPEQPERLTVMELADLVAGQLAVFGAARVDASPLEAYVDDEARAEFRVRELEQAHEQAHDRALTLSSELSHENRIRDEDHRAWLSGDLEQARRDEATAIRALSEAEIELARTRERLVGLRVLREAFGLEA